MSALPPAGNPSLPFRLFSSLRPWGRRSLWLAAALPGALAGCVAPVAWTVNDYVGPKPGPQVEPALALPATQPAPAPGGTAPATQPAEPLTLSVTSAILIGLENNPDLRVQRLNPDLTQTAEQIELAAFDPALAGSLNGGERRVPGSVATDSIHADSALTQFLPTGTTIQLDASTDFSNVSTTANSALTTRLGGQVTQSLLRGYGTEVNLASLRQARLDTAISQYELRGFAEALVQSIEDAYWDYALALEQVRIVQKSVDVAEQQLAQTREMVRVGKSAESDTAVPDAELALRIEDLINAKSAAEAARLLLLRLLSPPGPQPWHRPITLLEKPAAPGAELGNPEEHVALGLRMRPEMNQAKLQIQRNDLQIVKTRNGLLPKLDMFVNLGNTGYSSSFGGSIAHVVDRGNYDVTAGIAYQLPIVNRDAQARDRAAHLSRDQSVAALANLANLVQVDVRAACVEAARAYEQITATAASSRLQEVKLRVERAKLAAGSGTQLLVAIAERDLLNAQLAEVQAVVAYLKARVSLYRVEGSLLERRGISAPGRQPVAVGVKNY